MINKEIKTWEIYITQIQEERLIIEWPATTIKKLYNKLKNTIWVTLLTAGVTPYDNNVNFITLSIKNIDFIETLSWFDKEINNLEINIKKW